MRNKLRKIIALFAMVALFMGSIIVSDYEYVKAEQTTIDHGFKIDKNLYNIKWTETSKIWVKQTCRSMDSKFDKGVTLGYAKVYTGFATTKERIDGKYYQRVFMKGEMIPTTVSGSKRGMSQYLTVQVANGDYMQNTWIEPMSSTGSTSYSTTGGIGLGGKLGISRKKSKLTLDGGSNFSFKADTSVSYVEDSLVVITNKDDNGYAQWEYDYISSSKSKAQNAYLFGSSTQYGVFSWSMPANWLYCNLNLKVTATFGGGNNSTNERAFNMWTGKYNLGSGSTSINISYE